jgi:drug/metabolite transporter (DMT)-like permease
MSTLVWLGISSNRNSVLHTIGKLGINTNGYGTVNLRLLLVGLLWSIGGCFFAAATYGIGIKSKRLLYLFLCILGLVTVTAMFGILFDYRLSISLFLATAIEILEPVMAALIGWIVLFKPSRRSGLSDLVGSGLFGLFGLIFVTSLVLLAFPRVSFRF